MNWEQKFQLLVNYQHEHPESAVVFGRTKNGAPEAFLSALQRNQPFVPCEFLTYLSMTNGGHFDMFLLYGSDSSLYSSIEEETARWNTVLNRKKKSLRGGVVIGADPLGYGLVLDVDGKIYLIENVPPWKATLLAPNGFSGY